jgi:Ca2+-binding EF-hand superfamily protein
MKRVLLALALLVAPPAFSQPVDYMQRVQKQYRDLFAAYDANRDGTLTRAEAAASNVLAPVFDSMDTDRDGVVTQAELERWLADIPPAAR